MTGDDVAAALDGIVHEETQRGDSGVDLTVDAIHRVDRPGEIDFGGGELASAETTPLDPEKRNADDDYGWWELAAGRYLVAYNEHLESGRGPFVLQPRIELVERGASHPTLFVDALPRVPLSVPDAGLALKENARVSTLRAPPE
jgi:hypothetical protein